MSSTKSIIQLGLQLLKNGRLDANELGSYSDAFSILKVDVSKPLKLAALKSVFSTSDETAQYYEPSALNPEHINYPCNSTPLGDIQGFGEAEMSGSNELTMLEKYGTFVSVVTITDDVDSAVHTQTPVYDLFKTAAAIDDCLKTGEGNEKFLLVGCDFSGIQDTVYTISSKGALKTLRARSFMLELLTEHIIHEILAAVGSDRHAVVYSGGGGFSLLLPNSEETVRKINNFRIRINEWTFDEFSGRLFIAMDALPFGNEELLSGMSFRNIRQTQADNLDRLKRRKFIDQFEQLFTPSMPKQLTVTTECQISRRDDLPDEFMFDIGIELGEQMSPDNKHQDGRIWVSESCYHQFRIGDKLAAAQSVVRSQTIPEGTEPFFKYPDVNWSKEDKSWVYYRIGGQQSKSADCWIMNDWTAGQPILYANYVRKHGELSEYAKKRENESLKEEKRIAKSDHTATFQGLAASSCGADLIGALRMDVDNLGNMFSSIDNLVLLSACSRVLNIFFKVYLNKICFDRKTDILKKSEAVDRVWGNPGRNVSIIYAGGDDLFIVGAWDDTIELAFDIQQSFERFTNGRLVKDGGISGGLTLHQPKFPLYQMARLSADSEAYAKYDDDGDGLQRKNRISLFYDHSKLHRKQRLGHHNRSRYMLSMEWSLANKFLLPLMGVYRRCFSPVLNAEHRNYIEIDKFSLGTIEKWFAVIEKYQLSNQLYLPTMARVMRGIEHEFDEKETTLFEDLATYLYTTDIGKKNWISHFHIALNWLAYLRRTK